MISIGIVYFAIDHFSHNHHDHMVNESGLKNKIKSKWAVLTSLSIAMFLTPCIEIEAYYFRAGIIGWSGIFIVSIVYLITTIIAMLLLVYTGLKGISRFRSHYLEHHEKRITGIVLLILGILALIVKY